MTVDALTQTLQPALLQRGARARVQPLPALQARALAAPVRHRSLQGDQRHARPPRRRRVLRQVAAEVKPRLCASRTSSRASAARSSRRSCPRSSSRARCVAAEKVRAIVESARFLVDNRSSAAPSASGVITFDARDDVAADALRDGGQEPLRRKKGRPKPRRRLIPVGSVGGGIACVACVACVACIARIGRAGRGLRGVPVDDFWWGYVPQPPQSGSALPGARLLSRCEPSRAAQRQRLLTVTDGHQRGKRHLAAEDEVREDRSLDVVRPARRLERAARRRRAPAARAGRPCRQTCRSGRRRWANARGRPCRSASCCRDSRGRRLAVDANSARPAGGRVEADPCRSPARCGRWPLRRCWRWVEHQARRSPAAGSVAR